MTKPAAKSAAKPAAGKDVNKSEEIRKVATSMKAAGQKPRPILIIDTLKKRGVVVSSPQVSMVLKRMGFRLGKRRSSHAMAAQKSSARAGNVSIDDLVVAKKFVAKCGGTSRALAAIEALKRLEG